MHFAICQLYVIVPPKRTGLIQTHHRNSLLKRLTGGLDGERQRRVALVASSSSVGVFGSFRLTANLARAAAMSVFSTDFSLPRSLLNLVINMDCQDF